MAAVSHTLASMFSSRRSALAWALGRGLEVKGGGRMQRWWAWAGVLLGTLVAWGKPGVDYRSPTRSYDRLQLRGRGFWVERALLRQDAATARRACARYARVVDECLAALPAGCREELRPLNTYVLFGPKAPGGGLDNGLEYYRPGQPHSDASVDHRWSNCIVVYCAANYVGLTDLWAHKAVLHELAHAYHLLHWKERQPLIVAAYEHARRQGLYRQVTNDEGKRHDAYALTNQLEYFAQLSVMLFARCDYPPRDSAALRMYDPVGFKMVQTMWRSPPPSE